MIVTAAGLAQAVTRFHREPLLACDLEADSMHHYQEKVCLVQLSTPRDSVLIDPLAFGDLSSLAPIMADPAVRKLFHGADYDIRSLHRDFGIEVNNLFDTMIACQFLGEKEVGLAAVLKKRFGVELDKRYQKADWSKRPLSPGMLEYAVEDTRLLIDLYRQLESELHRKDRLSWVEEECELLSRVRVATRGSEPMFLRFKGAAALGPLGLAVLEELLRFRDEMARQRDLPSFKICGNDTIRDLAVQMPRNAGELSSVAGTTPRLVDRYGQGMLEAIARGMACPPDRMPAYPKKPRPVRDRFQEERLKKLKSWREEKSRELGIDGGILANNALLEQLADLRPQHDCNLELPAVMKKWQKTEFGAELTELLRRV